MDVLMLMLTSNVSNERISKIAMQCILEQADSWQAARQARGMKMTGS
jgi:hypothetical protein